MIDLKMIGVFDSGNPEKQRVVFQAMRNCNTGDYILSIARASQEGEDVQMELQPRYSRILPAMNLQSGDTLVIYTKAGEELIQNTEDRVFGFFAGCGRFYYAQAEEEKRIIKDILLLFKVTDTMAYDANELALNEKGEPVKDYKGEHVEKCECPECAPKCGIEKPE